MQNKDNKDDTDENVSTIPKVKQIVAMFNDSMGNEPGKTDVATEGKRRILIKGRCSVKDRFRQYAESGPNKDSTNETAVNPETDGMPTKFKGKGGLLYDPCLVTDSELDLRSDIIKEGTETGKGGLWNDPCLASDNEIELGSDIIEEGSETDFDLVVLDEVVLLVAQRYTQDALAAEEDNDYNRGKRHTANRQFILWT